MKLTGFLWALLLSLASCFNIRQVATTASVTTINMISTYTFRFDRTTDNSYTNTSYALIPVPTTGSVSITFSSNFTVTPSATCNSATVNSIAINGFTCSITGNTVTFGGLFNNVSNLFVSAVTIIVGNIKNPSPAIYTGPFTGVLGNDQALPGNSSKGILLTAGNYQSCSITFSPAYVNQASSSMQISLTPTNSHPSGSTLLVQFSGSSWINDIDTQILPFTSSMGCSNLTSNISSSIQCLGNAALKQITISNIFYQNVSSNFEISVQNFLSPPSNQPSDAITITSFSGGSKIDTCIAYPSGLIPNNFFSFSIIPQGIFTVNSFVALRFVMTLPSSTNEKDTFKIIFPNDTVFSYSSIFGTSFYVDPPTISGQNVFISYDSTVTASYVQNDGYTITIASFQAPPSTLPTGSITLQILRNGYPIMAGSAQLTATPATINASVTTAITTVWATTSYTFTINITNPISSSGKISITFPPSITISTNSTSCASVVGSGVVSSPTCNFITSTNSISLSSINASSANILAQSLKITIHGITNPPDIATTSSFTVKTYYTSSDLSLVETASIGGINSTVGTISIIGATVIPSNYTVLAGSVSYTFNFNNTYLIPIGGYVIVKIPTDITILMALLPSYCKMSLNNNTVFSGTACSGSTVGSFTVVTFSEPAKTSAIPAGSMISLQINTLCTNPSNTRIVTPFSIATYSSVAAIEAIDSGMTVQMTTPANFGIMSVGRESQQNSKINSYTFTLKQQAALPAGSIILITLPPNISMTTSSICTDLANITLSCSQSSNQALQVTLNAIAGATLFGITVSNIRNYGSYKPMSGSFTFITKTSDQVSTYASGSYLASSDPALTNSIPSQFIEAIPTFAVGAYGSPQSMTLKITPSSNKIPDYLEISLAPTFNVGTIVCSSFIGFTGSCTVITGKLLNITGALGTSQMIFTISGITTPTYTPTDTTIVSSFETGGYMIDQNSSLAWKLKCTLPCKDCTSVSTACTSCYLNNTLSSLFASNFSCLANCPSGYYSDTLTLECRLCSSTCLACSVVSSNCTTCNSTSAYPALNLTGFNGVCLAACPSKMYLELGVCVVCVTPCLTCMNSTKCLSCTPGLFYSNFNCGPTCLGGVSIPNNFSWTCDACSSQCATCSISINNCTGCSSSAAMYNGTCVTSCPYPLVINAGNCANCDSVCKSCSLVSSNCTACFTNTSQPYLAVSNSGSSVLGECKSTCDFLFYGDLTNGICQNCSLVPNLNCKNCSSASSCYDCNSGFVLYQGKCNNYTPTGYYNDGGVAVPCNSSCSSCNNINDCTGCVSLLLLSFRCVDSCPAGKVAQNHECVSCNSTHYFCEECFNTPTNCTKCVPGTSPLVFLTSGSCLTTCPDGTYPDQITSKCLACVSPCEFCSTISACKTCINGLFLSGPNCINQSSCPNGTVGINRVCMNCTNNCSTCSGVTSHCTSCNNGTFLYNTSSPTCLSSCPNNTYIDVGNQSCTGCRANCLTCSIVNTNCTACSPGLLLQNFFCKSTCDLGYYILGSKCMPCATNCANCSSNTTCFNCSSGLFLYNNNCSTSCPSLFPIPDIYGRCSSCNDTSCANCTNTKCFQCYYPKILFEATCLSNCPLTYVLDINLTGCVYSPNSSNSSTASTVLTSSLTTTSIFPVPFTIGAAFLAVACLMSKFQNQQTYVSGALYSLVGLLEWGACAFLLVFYYFQGQNILILGYLLVAGGVALIYLLNLIFLPLQNLSLRSDKRLRSWLDGSLNWCWYCFVSLLGLLTTNKFKNILFCKLFRFRILSAPLEDVGRLKVFYAFSFTSFISSVATIGGTTILLKDNFTVIDQLFMAYVDALTLSAISLILAIMNSRKPNDFFDDVDDEGLKVNKRIQSWDEVLNENVMPQYSEVERKSYMEKNIQSSRKLQMSSDLSDMLSHVSKRDISIQAEQILGEKSLISRLGTQSISDLSFFQRNNDISIQMDPIKDVQDMSIGMSMRVPKQDVSIGQSVVFQDASINPSLQMKDVSIVASQIEHLDKSIDQSQKRGHEVSIQYSQPNQQVSIQYEQPSQHEISIQYVPILTDQTVHMTKNQENLGIQCGVDQNNISVQYSAKPIFQQVAQQFGSMAHSSLQQPSDLSVIKKIIENKPALQEAGLKAELELDINQKLLKKQHELMRLQEQRRNRQKEEAVKAFQKKVAFPNAEQMMAGKRQVENDRINQMFNNDSHGNSSLINSRDQFINIPFNRKEEVSRVQSQRTEKQFIEMLSGNKNEDVSEINLSLSQRQSQKDSRVSKNSSQKEPRVEFMAQNKMIIDEDADIEQPEEDMTANYELLNGNTISGYNGTSVQKSRSTNINTNRRPPLPKSKRNILESSDNQIEKSDHQDEDIINHPMNPRTNRDFHHDRYYKEEEIQHGRKTNLTQFLDKKKRDLQSAQNTNRRNNLMEEDDALARQLEQDMRQKPLPPPRREQMITQNSVSSSVRRNSNSKRDLNQFKDLQFDNRDKIFMLEEDEELMHEAKNLDIRKSLGKKPSHQLLPRSNSKSRIPSNSKRLPTNEVIIEHPASRNRGYLRQTHSSEEKKKSLEKIYLNKMIKK